MDTIESLKAEHMDLSELAEHIADRAVTELGAEQMIPRQHLLQSVPIVKRHIERSLDVARQQIAELTRQLGQMRDYRMFDGEKLIKAHETTESLKAERDTLKRQLETAREALSGLVKAEQRYVEESGMEIDDPITDAVKAAESALSTRTDKGEDAGNHSETPNSSNCREILGGSADAIHGEDAQKGGE